MRKVTVKPLITNFMTPQKPDVVSASDIKMIYDPQNQITYFMGGGNSGPTRSNDGYKRTEEKTPGGGIHVSNDAERWTDD